MAKAAMCLPELYLNPDVEKELQDRLSRIEGHVRGVKRMLGEHGTCEDLLVQLAAIRAAVNQVQARLLENHMQTCVADAVRSGKGSKALERLRGALAQVLRT
jgi:DNA-binding FrmR family transcriptional regulator